MKATAPISGAANAQNASPAPRANSSLADFLQTGSTQDFKSIAATFFAAPTATPAKTQSALKNSKVENGNDPAKPKLPSDPVFALSQLALTVPTVVPDPLPAGGTKIFVSQGARKDDVVPGLPGPKTPTDSKEPATFGEPASLADKTGLQVVETAAKEAAIQPAPRPEDKKAAAAVAVPDQAQTPTTIDAVKHNATTAAKNDAPTLGANAGITADHTTPTPAPAIDSVPVTPVPESSSTPQLNATADSPATKAVAQSQSVTPGLAEDSKNSHGPSLINGLGKVQNRANKDSGNKDTRTTEPQTRKSTLAQAADEIASGSTVSSAVNGKANPSLSVQTHSISHPNVTTQKQIPGTTAPSIAATEMDGPDEALPPTESLPMSAKFVQGLSQSEFRVGMQSQEFGSIDIRTSVSRHMFSAEISVENSDVAKSMATDLPALHNRLAEQQVPVAHIVIQGQSLATSSGLAQDTQQRAWQPQAHAAVRSGEETPVSALSPVHSGIFQYGRQVRYSHLESHCAAVRDCSNELEGETIMMINSIAPSALALAHQTSTTQTGSTGSTDSTGSASSSDPLADSSSDLFLQLLVAQLKTQDPTSPMDPTQMVGQMLSMNQLNELIQIRQLLQTTSSHDYHAVSTDDVTHRSLITCQIFRFHFLD